MDKVSSKQTAQYTDKQNGEGIVVTTRDTAVVEDDVHVPQPAFPTDTFSADLGAFSADLIPLDDCSRTWSDDRTIMQRRTSKIIKEVVDKMLLPVVVRLRRTFWDDVHIDKPLKR